MGRRLREEGLIPAGAGQTKHARLLVWSAGAHPRGCGADQPFRGEEDYSTGSSPRVRGRRLLLPMLVRPKRLIPAGAGQTGASLPTRLSHRAHPRGCGADLSAMVVDLVDPGSSPRVRGRPRCTVGVDSGCAAHPRGCGADRMQAYQAMGGMGSSPRVRGRRVEADAGVAAGGLIPAGAGQTLARARATPSAGAHPRGCGADDVPVAPAIVPVGSSPRVRGRPPCCRGQGAVGGLIPAGAGQTRYWCRSCSAARAHPRGCGADGRR